MSEYVCVSCGLPITGGKMYGAGDGTGQKFACPECHWRGEAKRAQDRLEAEQKARDALRAGYLESIEKLQDSYVTSIENLLDDVHGLKDAHSVVSGQLERALKKLTAARAWLSEAKTCDANTILNRLAEALS